MPAPQDGFPRERTLSDEYLWLHESHSKIWKKKELEQVLFREVKVTQADYTVLQERLKEQHPDRDSPEYDGKMCDVQSVKLDVLRSIQENVRDDDDPEASHEDGSGINSLFPFALRFLDLTTLGLKYVPPGLPSPLFLRQEYDDISALIEREPKNTYGSVIITGQPGTGEVLDTLSHRV